MEQGQKQGSLASKIAKQLVAIAFGCLFLWLAFKGTDFNKIWAYAKDVDPIWLAFLCCSVVTSHIVRAWRWTIILRPLSQNNISLWNAFCATMIGYAVNLVIPRGGEIVRIIVISRAEQLPWAGVLPTMLIDRLMDIAVLCLVFAATVPVLPPELLEKMPFLKGGGILLALGSIVLLIALPKLSSLIRFVVDLKFVTKLVPERAIKSAELLADQFQEGTKSLTNAAAYPAVLLSTFLMWFIYWANNWILLQGFHLGSSVNLKQLWIVFTVGSVGVLIPSPGSIGSFHFFVKEALMLAAGTNEELALAFATVMHLVSFVGAICIPALICWIAQSNSLKSVRSEKPAPDGDPERTPATGNGVQSK